MASIPFQLLARLLQLENYSVYFWFGISPYILFSYPSIEVIDLFRYTEQEKKRTVPT